MEFVAGDDLAERMQRGPLPLDEAVAIARQVAAALDAAQESGNRRRCHRGQTGRSRRRGDFMKVAINRSGGDLKIGTAQKLFDWNGAWAPFYHVVDSQRGITAVGSSNVSEVASISIVQNWFAEFAEK
jgi:hypothetical protein